MDNDINNNDEIQPIMKYEPVRMTRFKEEFGNTEFRISKMTFVSFTIILLFVLQVFLGDPTAFLKQLNEGLRIFIYITTIILLWSLFGVIYYSVYREKTFLRGIGFTKLHMIDFARGLALLLVLFTVAPIAALGMSQIGYEVPGEIGLFLPEKLFGKILFAIMALTAGFCEEAVFRGYLLTRIRLLFKLRSWVIPVIVSSLLFGIPHLYQGFAGMVIITILGLLFALTYIRYKTIWPCVFAHFFLDFLQLFVPQIEHWFTNPESIMSLFWSFFK